MMNDELGSEERFFVIRHSSFVIIAADNATRRHGRFKSDA
jgi:hypothetical protein